MSAQYTPYDDTPASSTRRKKKKESNPWKVVAIVGALFTFLILLPGACAAVVFTGMSSTDENGDSIMSTIDEGVSQGESEVDTADGESTGDNPDIPQEHRSAMDSAEGYLDTGHFSKKGLYKQLKFEDYTNDSSQYAVNNVEADWNKEAVEAAESYLDTGDFSKKGLYGQLRFEDFTKEQSKYAVDNVKVNWNDEAVEAAENYLDTTPMSKKGLYNQLIFEKFTKEQAKYAVGKVHK